MADFERGRQAEGASRCTRCGAANQPAAQFCAACGARLGSAPGVYGAPGSTRKGMAIASLVLGIASIPTLAGLFVGGVTALVLGIVALLRASRRPAEYGGRGLAIGGIVCAAVSLVLVILLIPAISIPSLLRARTAANEASAIGDARTVVSAESTYAAYNGGYYDSLDCLVTPATCIPGYKGGDTPLLPVELARSTSKGGYLRTFLSGPPVPPNQRAGRAISPTSLMSFAYVLVPETPGQTGTRSFCVDSSGRLCAMADGSRPEVVNGSCDPGCPDVR